ncbi:hypothetical protein JHK84_033047 [Glycine max]|nr:hypothetical protein JHK85_033420 [Glycine max]KAG5139279.1 hypothetical protein JHK84_033047 [Glycine max]
MTTTTISREECGVVGIYGDPEASRLCYLALHALQHRGQEATGIVTVDNNVLQPITGMCLVSEATSSSIRASEPTWRTTSPSSPPPPTLRLFSTSRAPPNKDPSFYESLTPVKSSKGLILLSSSPRTSLSSFATLSGSGLWLREREATSRRQFGEILATKSPGECEVVIALADSGVVVAIGYAAKARVAYELGLIRSHNAARNFVAPSQELSPVRAVLEGKRVVVVDDSIVRGTTSSKIVN